MNSYIANNVVYILIATIIIMYIGQAVWIFIDCRMRNDQFIWIWVTLSMISCPIVIIIYLIITKYINKKVENNNYFNKESSYYCDNCGMMLQKGWKYCPSCSKEVSLSSGDNNIIGIASKVKRANYRVPIFAFLIGIILFAVFLTYNLMNISNSIQRVTIPSATNLTLNETGKYTIFYEYNSGEKLNLEDLEKLDISLIDKNTNEKLNVSSTSYSSGYSFGGHKGKSIFQFNVNKPGVYELSMSSYYSNKSSITIGIVNKFTSKILITVLGSMIILFGTIIALIMGITKSITRSR